MAGDVATIRIGCMSFWEFRDRSFRDIFVEAGVQGDGIDELFVGNMSAGRFVEQEHVSSLITLAS